MDVEAEVQVHKDVKTSSSTSSAASEAPASASTSSGVKIAKSVPTTLEPVEVEVRRDTPKGKALFAVSAIPKKKLIFEEDPFVFCQFSWNKHCGYSACDHCLRPLEIVEANISRLAGNHSFNLPYPDLCRTKNREHATCPECLSTDYCSEYCLKMAYQQYHKALCPFYMHSYNFMGSIDNQWRNMHHPPETTTIFLVVRLLARIIQAPNKQEMLQKILDFCHRSSNEHGALSHKFLGDKFKQQLVQIRLAISEMLLPTPYPEVENFLTPEGFKTLIALIATNGQGVATSPFSAWRRNVEAQRLPKAEQEEVDDLVDEILDYMEKYTGTEFIDNEGVGLYVKQSSVNHSCDPNAIIKFWNNNFRLALVSLRDIEPGEEICISYLDECQLNRSRHSRQKILMENYIFLCRCPKCISQCDDPDVTSDEEEEEEPEEEETSPDKNDK